MRTTRDAEIMWAMEEGLRTSGVAAVVGEVGIFPALAGRVRAQQLVAYVPETFGVPDAIVAAKNSHESYRPMETVTPLANSLGLSIQADISDKDYSVLATALFSQTTYAGKFGVVCWHNGELP